MSRLNIKNRSINQITASAFGLLVMTIMFLIYPQNADATGLIFGSHNWELDTEFRESVKVFNLRNDFDLETRTKSIMLNTTNEKTDKQLLSPLSLEQLGEIVSQINQASKPAMITIKGRWATKFDPGQNGQILDTYKLNDELQAKFNPIRLVVKTQMPESTIKQTNNLGINELVATGESDFSGSSRSRINNIRVGAAKYNGLILTPGEEFSFNKFLGDVDASNGFTPEIVIKGTDLKKEFGGGLCQVSTTVFRAAMNAGLPITERRNHSFAVQYYSPAGTDATIYTGVIDFKFQNNLSSHMMIQTRVEDSKLFYDFYGTKDDRVVELTDPSTFDRKTDGAMKAIWGRKVTLDGKIMEDEFYSNYRSPNLYTKESTVESSVPNPDAEDREINEGESL
jgi:vancomycin resistance protein YoaR